MRSILLLVAGGVLVVSTALVAVSQAVGDPPPSDNTSAYVSPSWTDTRSGAPTPAGGGRPVAPTTAPVSYPHDGPRSFDVVAGTSPVIGSAGQLMRFQVSIEQGVSNLDGAAVAAFVEETYAGARGWTSGGAWRFQRVGPGQPYDLIVQLATPGTRRALCGDGPDFYTNCRNGARVILNLDRWEKGAAGFDGPLTEYRRYVINHETGHRLGFGHELCPGPGAPAPVMQQQTLGLHGCVANAWPYQDGRAYHGQSGSYNDPVPSA